MMQLLDNRRDDELCRFYTSPLIGKLLVRLVTNRPPSRIVDLGSGSGILTQAARTRWKNSEIVTVDLDSLCVQGLQQSFSKHFRTLVRRLIHVDHHVQKLAEPMTLSFAAAMQHTPELLPEALIEDMSFAGGKSVYAMLREIIGIKGNLPVEVEAVLAEFKKVCEIRHCCIHRFGRLGAKNAQVLGMSEHSEILENAFDPTFDDLLTIADILRTFVKTLNNFVFQAIVERVSDDQSRKLGIAYPWDWSWDYERDRDRFTPYYLLFASKIDSPPSVAERVIYETLKAVHQLSKQKRRRNVRKVDASPANEIAVNVQSTPEVP